MTCSHRTRAIFTIQISLLFAASLFAGCTQPSDSGLADSDPPGADAPAAMSLLLRDCTTFLANVVVDEEWARNQLPEEYVLATFPAGRAVMDVWSSECTEANSASKSVGPFEISWVILPIANSNDVLHLLGFAAVTTINASPEFVEFAQRVSPEVQVGEFTFSRDARLQVDVQGPDSTYTISGPSQSPNTSQFLQNWTILHSNGTMWIEGVVEDDDLLHPASFEPRQGPTTDAPPAGAPMTTGTGRESRGDYKLTLAAGFLDDADASRPQG